MNGWNKRHVFPQKKAILMVAFNALFSEAFAKKNDVLLRQPRAALALAVARLRKTM
jgi:hypothetical protein